MRQLSARPVFALSFLTNKTQNLFQKSQCSAFSTDSHQNPFPSHYSRRPTPDDGRSIRVSVWWDFENCNLPLNTNVFRVSQSIFNVVRVNGMKGPVQITAFGDVMQISRTNQQALSSNGITLIHVPSGSKNSADRALLIHLMNWVSRNPPPAHIFLISGDNDFSDILHRLRMENYNILLASPDSAPNVLCSAATIMWQWSSLLKGENLAGKIFNQPPDGPYNSNYGHYRAPLEDPFASVEQNPCLNNSVEPKIRPIPKAVLKHVSQIINSCPDGISITNLRAELSRSNVAIDKDFFGHNKFSRFLQAMPTVLKIHYVSDGQHTVWPVESNKCLDEDSLGTCVEPDLESGPNEDGEGGCIDNTGEKSITPPTPEVKIKAQLANSLEARKEEKQNEGLKPKSPHGTNSQDVKKEEKGKEIVARRKAQEIREHDEKVKIAVQPEKPVADEIKQSSKKNESQLLHTRELGTLRRIWIVLFGNKDEDFVHTGFHKDGNKDTPNEKAVILNQSFEFVSPALFSPSSHEAIIYDKNANRNGSLFDQIMRWFKFSGSRENDNLLEKGDETGGAAMADGDSVFFSKESSWKELVSFIDTPQGSATLSRSKTKENLAQNLQKHGPPSLKSISKTELLHLVDLLVSDNKWVEECSLPSPTNGLRHIFSTEPSGLPEPGERKHPNPAHTGGPHHVAHKNLSTKPRGELLADCQKFVDDIVKEHPEGFNLGSFRKLFLERNGYELDLQRLGYNKLVNLLQIMPGVKIESGWIFPSGPFKVPDLQKNDDSDSPWDELGPVDDLDQRKGKNGPGPVDDLDQRKVKVGPGPIDDLEQMKVKVGPGPIGNLDQGNGKIGPGRAKKCTDCDYDPVRDEDLSGSDDEASGNKTKPKHEEESSLLQILDTWYGNKGTGSKNGSGPDLSPVRTRSENPCVGPAKKHKPSKSYSFVAEQPRRVDNKDELVDGILVSLKKPSERSSVDSRVFG